MALWHLIHEGRGLSVNLSPTASAVKASPILEATKSDSFEGATYFIYLFFFFLETSPALSTTPASGDSSFLLLREFISEECRAEQSLVRSQDVVSWPTAPLWQRRRARPSTCSLFRSCRSNACSCSLLCSRWTTPGLRASQVSEQNKLIFLLPFG